MITIHELVDFESQRAADQTAYIYHMTPVERQILKDRIAGAIQNVLNRHPKLQQHRNESPNNPSAQATNPSST